MLFPGIAEKKTRVAKTKGKTNGDSTQFFYNKTKNKTVKIRQKTKHAKGNRCIL